MWYKFRQKYVDTKVAITLNSKTFKGMCIKATKFTFYLEINKSNKRSNLMKIMQNFIIIYKHPYKWRADS